MRGRLYKPTRRGYVIFGMLAISVVGIVVGVIIGGGTGVVLDVIGGGLLAFLIFALFPSSLPRRYPNDPRDEFLRPPRRGDRD